MPRSQGTMFLCLALSDLGLGYALLLVTFSNAGKASRAGGRKGCGSLGVLRYYGLWLLRSCWVVTELFAAAGC